MESCILLNENICTKKVGINSYYTPTFRSQVPTQIFVNLSIKSGTMYFISKLKI